MARGGRDAAELSHAREFQVDPLACTQSPAGNGQPVIAAGLQHPGHAT